LYSHPSWRHYYGDPAWSICGVHYCLHHIIPSSRLRTILHCILLSPLSVSLSMYEQKYFLFTHVWIGDPSGVYLATLYHQRSFAAICTILISVQFAEAWRAMDGWVDHWSYGYVVASVAKCGISVEYPSHSRQTSK
jgi:hypothetical protein